jgi:hypothetical protein
MKDDLFEIEIDFTNDPEYLYADDIHISEIEEAY